MTTKTKIAVCMIAFLPVAVTIAFGSAFVVVVKAKVASNKKEEV